MLAAAGRHRRLHVGPLDDRCVPATLSVADVTVIEGTSGTQNAAVRVTLSEPLKKAFTVDYGTANGTATAGTDYVAAGGQLAFGKGQTAQTIVVPVFGDQVSEGDESFTVRIFGATKGVKIADGRAAVTILDSRPGLSITSEFAGEGGVMTFTVTLSAPLNDPFTVDFATADSDAVAGEDYAATSGTLAFAPGVTAMTFSVPILADAAEEYDEQFFVSLSNPSAPVFIGDLGWGYIYGELGNPWG